MYISIPTFNSKINEWSATEFLELRDFILFVKSKIKKVGQYNLSNTFLWRQQALNFTKNGQYTLLPEDTKKWREYWDFEKLKSKVGVIIDDFYISEHYYFYLNFCPIYNVLEQSTEWPEVWDSHYHYLLHKKVAKLTGKHTVITKKRRWGLSFLEVANIHRVFIFQRDSICKFICKDEDPNSKNFRILDSYRLFTDEHTAWVRPIMGSYPKIVQKIQQTDMDTKKITYKGRMSIVESVVTKLKPANGVGLYMTVGFWDEAGIQNNLIKSVQYNEKSVKQGGVVKGEIVVGGSVGELKDSENLKELIDNPQDYGFYAVEDEPSSIKKRGIFIPESYNYVDEITDPDDEEIVVGYKKYYDEDGNSFVEEAVKQILEKRERTKNKSPQAYRLELSQGPLTLAEAFDEREENIFPTHLISDVFEKLFLKKETLGIPVELFYTASGKIKHRIIRNTKINDYPINKDTKTEGCIILYEPPPENCPLGLHYAGVDTISSKKSTYKTSQSLMSCHIFKGRHNVEGEFGEKVLVAEVVCRCDDYEETYTRVQMLCEYYNAKSLVENNHETYIQWLISKKKQRLLIKANEINNLKDIIPNYSSNSSYGITTSKKTTEYLFDLIITYLENVIAKDFDDKSGDVDKILGVHTIKDYMVLKEMLKWSPNANVDRLISFGLALWAATIFTEQMNVRIGIKKDYTSNMPKNNSMFNKNKVNMFRKAKMF